MRRDFKLHFSARHPTLVMSLWSSLREPHMHVLELLPVMGSSFAVDSVRSETSRKMIANFPSG
jgi:hypothetical protein